MTHAWKKHLLLLKEPVGSTDLIVMWTEAERMDILEAERSVEGAIRGQPCKPLYSRVGKVTRCEKVQKSYPLRKRLCPVKDKTCKVLLTRLEDVTGSMTNDSQSDTCWISDATAGCFPENVHNGNSKMEMSPAHSTRRKCRTGCSVKELDPDPPEPRKRRLASLNAEAVNNLLFQREEPRVSARHFRRDPTKVTSECISKSLSGMPEKKCTSLQKSTQKVCGRRNRNVLSTECNISIQSLDNVSEEVSKSGENEVVHHPAPKRLASLNAVAFLRLTHEKVHPMRPRSKLAPDLRSENHCTKPKVKWAKSNKKNCVKSKNEMLHGPLEDRNGWQEELNNDLQKTEQEPPRIAAKIDSIQNEPSSNYHDGIEALYHRLPLLMGGQAAMKPEIGRPGEKSPTPKQEFHQPSFPLHQLHTLPIPGIPTDCTCLFESSDITPLDGFYVSYSQSGVQYNNFSRCSLYPKGEEFSQPAACEGILVSQSTLPSSTPFRHLRSCNSGYCFGDDNGVNSYSLCGVVHLPFTRISNVHTGHSNYPYKMPFTAESCKSVDQLGLPTPPVGHPMSPAHPLSGCPVPSVPPAAEPVPYLQTPNSEPQIMATLKMARECPQSSKPPSGSKSGYRNTSCVHSADSKTSRSRAHPKQQRISRRRATNGWVPVGASCEKAVYVVNEPEPAVRKSYQAVERDGEIIRVRDTVLLKSGPRKKSMPYVAKISALWEDPTTGELMMSLFWYYRPEHTQGGRNPSMHQNEIFASRHQDENSIACIEEKCYVLTFAEYCRFCALVKRRDEAMPGQRAAIVPPSEEYCTPAHRNVPEDTDPDLVFLCRHMYDFRLGRILKNPQ
ncbi:bromo adjacent homology domain-containing 1 protein [Ambystoma mexicanum]|uniref:bromo adjacent homology domain-containing 1 protein n=1 Tax=Ambystoma mexicanum TaxID=8296 RepID=UPI0037E9AF33